MGRGGSCKRIIVLWGAGEATVSVCCASSLLDLQGEEAQPKSTVLAKVWCIPEPSECLFPGHVHYL